MKITVRTLEALLIVSLLAVILPLSLSLRTEQYPENDSRENLQIALNLRHFGVYSVQEPAGERSPSPTTKREPLYPTLLAVWMVAAGHGGTAEPTVRRLAPDILRSLKSLNALLHAGLVLAGWWAARTFFRRPWPALAAAALIAFNSSMLSTIDVFLSEIPGALLLATSGTLFYLVYSRKSFVYPILAGLSLGALALTKAVFFYFLVLLVLGAAVWLAVAAVRKNWNRRSRAAKWLVLALAALAVYSPWFARNQQLGETLQVDERGESVLAVRAEYSTMSWKQYAASFFFFTPAVGPRLTSALFGPETARSFDRDRPESFYQKARRGTGEVNKTAVERNISTRRAAVRVMAEHLPMMCLLTLPFAYRGAFVQVGFNVLRVPAPLVYFTLVYSVLFVPGLIVLTIVLARKRDPRWVFLLPAYYSYLFHSLITHYIPRYSLPLIPIFVIALVGVTETLVKKRLENETRGADSLPE